MSARETFRLCNPISATVAHGYPDRHVAWAAPGAYMQALADVDALRDFSPFEHAHARADLPRQAGRMMEHARR